MTGFPTAASALENEETGPEVTSPTTEVRGVRHQSVKAGHWPHLSPAPHQSVGPSQSQQTPGVVSLLLLAGGQSGPRWELRLRDGACLWAVHSFLRLVQGGLPPPSLCAWADGEPGSRARSFWGQKCSPPLARLKIHVSALAGREIVSLMFSEN